jgi:hypothetical protein
MKYLWQETYRVCGCTMTEPYREMLPGCCPEHDHDKQTRSKIPEPRDFNASQLGLHAAPATSTPDRCQHQSNPLTCPFCEVLERKP